MLSASPRFTQRAQAQMRPISWALFIAFDKQIDESIGIFTLDQSLLNGPDILANNSDDVIQNWDKYPYVDYSGRVISLEWSHSFEMPASVSVAMADIVLDNHDDFFTPGAGSVIDGFILPRRPLRIYAGFGGENVPVFVGLTEKLPTLDDNAKTATFHCVDFLDSLFNRPLDESVMYVNKRTDEILSDLLQKVGLLSAQFQLDTGLNRIPFAYFEKGKKFGDAAKELMEAELGRLYMNELGVIRFKSLTSFSTTSVYTFDGSNTVSRDRSKQDDIINVVEVKGKPRAVQDNQPIWQSSQSYELLPGKSIDVWADFPDPAVTVIEPVIGRVPNASFFIVRTTDSQTGPEVGGVTLTNFDVFATSAKMTLTNNNTFAVYVTEVEVWGSPAKIIGGDSNEIYVRLQNDTSVEKYDEHVMTIENDFVQSDSEATSIASMVLFRHSEYGTTFDQSVKGTPALQLDDAITVNDGVASDTLILTEQVNQIAEGRYTQRIRATKVERLTFFVLDQSLLNGPDVLQL